MIDYIAGFACLPVGIYLFLDQFKVIPHTEKLFGVSVLLIAAVALVIVQVTNIIDSHVQGHSLLIAYSVHGMLLLPSIIYFLSLLVAMPAALMAALPLIFACFIFVEGLYCFFMFT
jgi:hypothetical protein